MEEHALPPGSTAHHPDLDWSQVRETILMMELAVAQIETAMKDSDGSVGVLADSFTSMMDSIRLINDEVRALPDDEKNHAMHQTISRHCEEVISRMQSVIIAFQFYDKLTQRLNHVSRSIDGLANLIGSPGRLYNPEEWRKLQELVRSKYTMEEERVMFDAITRGMNISQALALYHSAVQEKKKHEEGDIELF
ncbi:MAG: hypothetical protein AB7U30_02655 [Sulfuricellaceae bacterium]|jgi:hypothetical protein